MSLRFLADHCISRSIIQSLENEGHTVYMLKDHIPADSPDKEDILKAQGLDAILISLDGDFADIVRYPPDYYKGIVALQLRNHPEIFPQLLTRFNTFISSHPDITYYKGKLLLVEAHRIRVRG